MPLQLLLDLLESDIALPTIYNPSPIQSPIQSQTPIWTIRDWIWQPVDHLLSRAEEGRICAAIMLPVSPK
jgi:hypothetical protein